MHVYAEMSNGTFYALDMPHIEAIIAARGTQFIPGSDARGERSYINPAHIVAIRAEVSA